MFRQKREITNQKFEKEVIVEVFSGQKNKIAMLRIFSV
jgi:hypothetical protein